MVKKKERHTLEDYEFMTCELLITQQANQNLLKVSLASTESSISQ